MSNRQEDQTYTLKQLIGLVRAAQYDLEQNNEPDAALRFEILGDYLEEDVAMYNRPLTYTPRMLGL